MASTDVSINQLPTISNIEAGNFVIVQTENSTNKLDFKDFVVGLENTTFANTLSTATTNVDTLSTAFPSMSHAILRENGTVTGAGATLIDVEVSSNKLTTSVNLLKPNSLVKVKIGLTVALPQNIQVAVTLQVSTDGVSYSEIDSKYLNGTPNLNMQGIFVLGPNFNTPNNVDSGAFEILVDPSAVGDNNAFHVKVSIRAESGETIYINRGSAANDAQKSAGISYITLEEVFNNGNQTITSLD